MISLIWLCVLCLLSELVWGDLNPYTEALRSRPWYSKHGYVEVRPGAHMFYWLYYADGRFKGANEKPLVIWIQGGPGIAASGVGNFLELGPLDRNMQPRNHTWVNGRNVLLIDHPVGTGFSYVANSSLLAKTDHEVAMDLERLIKVFYKRHKKFHTTPAYLFSQSYGGKICPRLAFYLYKAIQTKTLKMNFKGIGIGSGWVDPKESTLMQPQYLYHMGIIDQHTYLKGTVIARQISECIDNRDYKKASKLNIPLFRVITDEAGMLINFNNINQGIMYKEMSILDATVNLYVKPTMSMVNQNMKWSYVSEDVFESLKMNFFLPSTSFVEILLNKTDLKVAIYNGNLDVVTPLAGATNWVHKLRWPGAQEFKLAPRTKIEGIMKGFRKIHGNLSFWWVFGSGHWVPEDNPVAMSQILDYVMKQ